MFQNLSCAKDCTIFLLQATNQQQRPTCCHCNAPDARFAAIVHNDEVKQE